MGGDPPAEEFLHQSPRILVTASSLDVRQTDPSFSFILHTLERSGRCFNLTATQFAHLQNGHINKIHLTFPLGINEGLFKLCLNVGILLRADRRWPLAKMAGHPGAKGKESHSEATPVLGILALPSQKPRNGTFEEPATSHSWSHCSIPLKVSLSRAHCLLRILAPLHWLCRLWGPSAREQVSHRLPITSA